MLGGKKRSAAAFAMCAAGGLLVAGSVINAGTTAAASDAADVPEIAVTGHLEQIVAGAHDYIEEGDCVVEVATVFNRGWSDVTIDEGQVRSSRNSVTQYLHPTSGSLPLILGPQESATFRLPDANCRTVTAEDAAADYWMSYISAGGVTNYGTPDAKVKAVAEMVFGATATSEPGIWANHQVTVIDADGDGLTTLRDAYVYSLWLNKGDGNIGFFPGVNVTPTDHFDAIDIGSVSPNADGRFHYLSPFDPDAVVGGYVTFGGTVWAKQGSSDDQSVSTTLTDITIPIVEPEIDFLAGNSIGIAFDSFHEDGKVYYGDEIRIYVTAINPDFLDLGTVTDFEATLTSPMGLEAIPSGGTTVDQGYKRVIAAFDYTVDTSDVMRGFIPVAARLDSDKGPFSYSYGSIEVDPNPAPDTATRPAVAFDSVPEQEALPGHNDDEDDDITPSPSPSPSVSPSPSPGGEDDDITPSPSPSPSVSPSPSPGGEDTDDPDTGGPTDVTKYTPKPEDLVPAKAGQGVQAPDTVKAGDTITLTFTTPPPSDVTADVWMFSTPVQLLSGVTIAAGQETLEVTIPANAVNGEHRIAVYTTNGALVGYDVINVTGGVLASTGAGVEVPAAIAGIVILFGGVLIALGNRRRAAV